MPQDEDTTLEFTCEGKTSNPTSFITWKLGNENITDKAKQNHMPGDNNADYVTSILEMNVTRQMNGQELVCSIVYEDTPVGSGSVTLDIHCE